MQRWTALRMALKNIKVHKNKPKSQHQTPNQSSAAASDWRVSMRLSRHVAKPTLSTHTTTHPSLKLSAATPPNKPQADLIPPLTANHARTLKTQVIRIPPYAFAGIWQRLHGVCPLCGVVQSVSVRYVHGLCAACRSSIMVPAYDYRLDGHMLRLTQITSADTYLDKIRPATACSAAVVDADDTNEITLQIAGFYQYPVNQLISQWKQHEAISAFGVLAALLSRLSRPVGYTAANSVILPIPSTQGRLIERGFNPTLILARYLAYHWQVPLWIGLHRHDSLKQQGLDRQARLTNVAEDFYLVAKLPVRRVILFDDVVTTGATIIAATTALRKIYPGVQIHAVGVAHGTAGVDGMASDLAQMLDVTDAV